MSNGHATFFGNIVRASEELIVQNMNPLNPLKDINIGTSINVDGAVVFEEKATNPSAPSTTQGTIWVRDDAKLIFTDNTHIDHTLEGATGPAGGSTDNAIVRFDGAGGELLKDSTTLLDDLGDIDGPSIQTINATTGLGQGIGTLTTGDTFIGASAGAANTTGINNTFIGIGAGQENLDADSGTFVGANAGVNNNGTSNTFIGFGTGRENISGTNNVYLGDSAGYFKTTGDDNVIIGYNAGRSANNVNGCILIGNRAGENNILNNRLMIDNTNTNIPLIDGNFLGVRRLNFNGEINIGESTDRDTEHRINGKTSGGVSGGSATAVPNQPVAYLNIKINGNTTYAIPYFNSA